MQESTLLEEESPSFEESPSKPLCETLCDLESDTNNDSGLSITSNEENASTSSPTTGSPPPKAYFFVYCSRCQKLCRGKLRVRCGTCQGGAITVLRDPKCWDDVLKKRRIHGHCETSICIERNSNREPDANLELPYVEFYFKCAEHVSEGEKDFAAPLNLVRINLNSVPCLACTDVR